MIKIKSKKGVEAIATSDHNVILKVLVGFDSFLNRGEENFSKMEYAFDQSRFMKFEEVIDYLELSFEDAKKTILDAEYISSKREKIALVLESWRKELKFQCSGIVKDFCGNGVAGAKVIIENSVSFTDFSGYYVVENISIGTKPVSIIRTGYNSYNSNVDIKWNSVEDFILKEQDDAETMNPHSNGKFQELMDELQNLIGLDSVKKDVASMVNLAKVISMRRKNGLKSGEMSFHLVFQGNPGTGKTTVARLIGKIYKEMGILKSGHFIEVDRSELVAGYVGQTALKVKKILEKARGGVLFIDEAYSLYKEEGNDFGSEAIDTLLKVMEDERNEFLVIVAGYEEPMNKFLNSNPGLQSRFNKFINFKDYTVEEMGKIFETISAKNDYRITNEGLRVVKEIFCGIKDLKKENFSNARLVRNIFEKLIVYQANRLVENQDNTKEELELITIDDIYNLLDCEELIKLN